MLAEKLVKGAQLKPRMFTSVGGRALTNQQDASQ
jgi:hypothetical protein